MLGRLLDLFRGRSIVIQGVAKLPDGQSKKFDIGDPLAGGRQFVLCRLDGELFAVDALCPHEGGRISDGPLVDGRHVMCPLHNYKFDPKSGAAVGRVCKNARTYRVREEQDGCRVWV